MTPNTSPPVITSDIVESELQDMLQTVIDARCGLSAIHQLLDGAQTMSDIRARYGQWQADQRAAELQPMSGTPNKPANSAKNPAQR